jgi:formamidopyrimidine-DNA glycosylase
VEPAPFRRSGDDYTCIQFPLADGRTLRFRDVRRLGTVELMAPKRFESFAAAIGPEPLEASFTAERFTEIVRASTRAIKTILMDQRRVAGIGNIYANEALWRARTLRPPCSMARRSTFCARQSSSAARASATTGIHTAAAADS